jgi:large subunit ribosomal protein L25
VLLRDFQMHAWKPLVMHVDFQRVGPTTRINKKVPIHFVNEENSPAVKTDKCLVNHVMTEVEINCLASELPEYLTVDLGEMVKGQSLHVNDLKLPKGAKVVLHGKPNPVMAVATAPVAEEEAVTAEAAAAAPAPAKTAAKTPAKSKKK